MRIKYYFLRFRDAQTHFIVFCPLFYNQDFLLNQYIRGLVSYQCTVVIKLYQTVICFKSRYTDDEQT